MGYTGAALRGFGWNSALKVSTTLLTAGKIFLLARLLSPYDFGLFSLIAITLGITESLTETGINTTIIQSERSVKYFLDTAWVIAIIRGFLVGSIMIILGFVFQWWYHEPQLLPLICIAAFVPCIKGFINPAIISLQKQMFFFRDSLYRFTLLFIEVIVTIIAAVIIKSALVFIIGMLVAAVAEVLISFWFFADRPQLGFVRSRAVEIWHNAKGLNIAAVLGYLVQNIDNLLIGKILGTVSLGLYANGYGLSQKVNLDLAKSVQVASLPIYVRLLKQPERLQRAFWRSFFGSTGLFTVLSLPLIFFPGPVVQLLFGERWLGVVPILPLLALAGILQSMFTLLSTYLTAKRDYRWLNLALAAQAAGLLLLVWWWAPHGGLLGGVWAVFWARLLSLPIIMVGLWPKRSVSPSR